MRKLHFLVLFILMISISFTGYAQEMAVDETVSTQDAAEEVVIVEGEEFAGNITLDFSDADIRSVLKIISLKTGVNIVASPDVTGTVSIYLDDVPWEKALDVILSTYGFGYEKRANVISVAPLDKLVEAKRIEQELAQVQPTITEVFQLKYLDALDAKKALEPLISPRGRITVLESTGKTGWEFGGESLGKRETKESDRQSLTKILLVTDIPPVIDELKAVLEKVDIKPRQVMIEAKILEVSRDYLEDIGWDYSTQTVGATDITIDADDNDDFRAGGRVSQLYSTTQLPAIFDPASTSITPGNVGMQLAIKKILGSRYEAIFHALEEDVYSNLLSAPRIMTLDNQEATILVGEMYPIITTSTSESSSSSLESLDYYQELGIQLNVVPQISAGNMINMIIHPSITSYVETVGTSSYPRITTREVETQVLINDGETIVIGGLMKDYNKESEIGVPWLSNIPFLGWFFRRDTVDTEKIELLIFITATIVDESGLTDEEFSFLEEQMSSPEYKEGLL